MEKNLYVLSIGGGWGDCPDDFYFYHKAELSHDQFTEIVKKCHAIAKEAFKLGTISSQDISTKTINLIRDVYNFEDVPNVNWISFDNSQVY